MKGPDQLKHLAIPSSSSQAEGMLFQLADGSMQSWNAAAENLLGLTREELQSWNTVGFAYPALQLDGTPVPPNTHPAAIALQTGQPCLNVVMGLHLPNDRIVWLQVNAQPLFQFNATIPYAVVSHFAALPIGQTPSPGTDGKLSHDYNERHSQTLIPESHAIAPDEAVLRMAEEPPTITPLLAQQQAEAESEHLTQKLHYLVQAVQHLVAARDLTTIMAIVRTAARQLTQADGATFVLREGDQCYYADEDAIAALWKGQRFPLEQCISGWSMLNREPAIIDDIYTDPRIPIAAYRSTFVQSLVMTPIRTRDPIGAIGTYWATCGAPTPQAVELLQALADAAAIALENSHLYTTLEQRVQERTTQLQQSLNFEALLKRITDSVRDSLDEQHILQTAVQELAQGLKLEGCITNIYNQTHTTATTTHAVLITGYTVPRQTFAIPLDTHLEIYQTLFQGKLCQVCNHVPEPMQTEARSQTILACSLRDNQEILGDLWLLKPTEAIFNDQEVRLVEQVATQCAIALRQSRLYRAAQLQVTELERLNQLKDDFLSTVSHELRAPMASIKMAVQMLEVVLGLKHNQALEHLPTQVMLQATQITKARQYFQILNQECQRESRLINDLLDLARLDTGTPQLTLTEVTLEEWLPAIVNSFFECTQQQQQTLQLQLEANLPPLVTDLPSLERIITELLHNACKYTPPTETIAVTVQSQASALQIAVSNSGIEITTSESELVFDKFYRIPNNDPWKQGGTGLGLALVKRLVGSLQGTIQLTSDHGWTTFTLLLPWAISR